jgi:hypothetical protein
MFKCQIFPVSPVFGRYLDNHLEIFCDFVTVFITICFIIHSSRLTFGPGKADRAASLHPSKFLAKFCKTSQRGWSITLGRPLLTDCTGRTVCHISEKIPLLRSDVARLGFRSIEVQAVRDAKVALIMILWLDSRRARN